MRYRESIDPFHFRQPPLEFLEDLTRPLHTETPAGWNTRPRGENEAWIRGAELIIEFPDPEGLLDTAYEDFREFLKVSLIEDGAYIFRIIKGEEKEEESYTINVTDTECIISSGDTEGIRRALFFIEDEMHRREGSFLPLGIIHRRAVIQTRISRCFFSPHYGSESDGELADDIDYYPENYLNRLAHEGVNGLWIQEHLRKILSSDIIPEYGNESAERIRRLNRVIDRCKRYGIKIYLEGVEPASTYNNPALLNHPDVLGQPFGDYYAFCISTPKGQSYIKESITKLFTLIPDLAGLITISVGESVASCAGAEVGEWSCPNCQALGLSRAEALAKCEKLMAEALREVKPDAELISWTYALRSWDEKDVSEYYQIRTSEAVTMQNFEDLGEVIQLGKPRVASDYWLAYAGPGKIFKEAAEVGKQRNMTVYAKIQVCNSHEVATVPYIPVPGILYDKYKYMHEYNVRGVLYCWYFGSYPSLMNKAAGELAFAPFYRSKQEFLKHLAAIYWGREAEKAVEAWNLFEAGYTNYPINMAFEWFGPMADGPVWPLHLKPVDLPVSSTWKTIDMVGCDRLGEFMLMGHTHEEALALCEKMSNLWEKGTQLLDKISSDDSYEKKEQQSVAKALACLFESGTNILKFYLLRNQLGFMEKDAYMLLEQMSEIVRREKEISAALSDLCEKDKRLGYHAEANGFKFFPEKLKWRIGLLDELLGTEFQEVKRRVNEGKFPLEFYWGLAEGSRRYPVTESDINAASWDMFMFQDGSADENTRIRIAEIPEKFIIQIAMIGQCDDLILKPEFRMFHPYVPLKLQADGSIAFMGARAYSLFGEEKKKEFIKWNCKRIREKDEYIWTISLNKKDFKLEKGYPFRLAVSRMGETESMWEKGDRYYTRLIFGHYSPDSFVFIIPMGRE